MAQMAIYNHPLLHLFLLLLLTSNSSSQSTTKPNAVELDTLLTIKREWGDPAALSSWSTSNWTGVTCDNSGQVTALSFHNFQIAKPIPASICSLKNLTYLDLSYNNLTGEFPTALYGCSALQYLDLSNNALTGDIRPEFSNLHLSFLNLSSNQLAGEVPESLQSPAYEGSFLRNRDLCATVNLNMNLPACRYGGHGKLSTSLIFLFSVLAGIALFGVVAIRCLIVRRQKHRQDLTMWKMTAFRALEFSESDILCKLHDENVIGSGGSGKVYRIPLRGKGGAGMEVAVKRLWSTSKSEAKLDKEFDSEVKILGDIRHNNIASLLCCISSEETKLLVYEYVENGSLDRHLHHRERAGALAPLDWPTRLTIAIDAARGLSYMHHECAQPIMHRDVKSSNILLDPGFHAKIADFGLARILVKSGEPESVSAIGGTFGYMAPEYGYRDKVNEKVDVFSFGVVLLELVTGRVKNDGGAECCLAEWAWRRYKVGGPLHDAVDEDIQDRAFLDDAVAVFMLGVICTGDDPTTRPSMKEVLDQLLRYDRTSSVASACRDECMAPARAGDDMMRFFVMTVGFLSTLFGTGEALISTTQDGETYTPLLGLVGVLAGVNLLALGFWTSDNPISARARALCAKKNLGIVGVAMASSAVTAVGACASDPVNCFGLFKLLLVGLSLVMLGVLGA